MAAAPPASAHDRPNVAVVVLDTLRKDAFDEAFDWLPGHRFENVHSPAEFTAPAHASLFTGLYPSEHGAGPKAKALAEGVPTLAELLGERGYRCRCLSANPHLSPEYGLVRGFDSCRMAWLFDDFSPLFDWAGHARRWRGLPRPLRYGHAVLSCARDDTWTRRSLRHVLARRVDALPDGTPQDKGAGTLVGALEDLRVADGGEFLFLNLMEVHDPYVAPPAYLPDSPVEKPAIVDQVRGLDAPAAARIRAAYDACVDYLATVYRDVFAVLERSFDYVVTTSDHGHCLGDDGRWGHGYGVHPAVTHVPLCVSGPNVDETRTTATASLLDLHRTVCTLAGVDAASRGRDLFDLEADGARLTEFLGLYPNRVRALAEAGLDASEVERLDTPRRGVAVGEGYYGYHDADGFHEYGTGARPDDPEGLLSELAATLQTRTDDAEADLSPALRSRLEDLGYR